MLSYLLENQLYVKGKKCEVYVSKISFFGYDISQVGISMNEGKVTALTYWLTPVIWFSQLKVSMFLTVLF